MPSSQFDRIWCMEYDEDSYHRNLQQISFQKYLRTILSSPHFPAFQKMAHQQLNDERQWNERSWILIQLFEYLNQVFDPIEFEKNLQFVPTPKSRKIFGCFRMWIDLQRLYLLFFLKMDRIQFQEDRIFFTLYRLFLFLTHLLQEYQLQEFNQQFLHNFSKEFKKRCEQFKIVIPHYLTPLLQSISNLVPNYLEKRPVADPKDREQIKKLAFQKLTREYQMIPDFEQRLKHNVNFQDKFREMKKVEGVIESPEIMMETSKAQRLYNPRVRIKEDFKAKCESEKIPFDEAKLQQQLKQYQEKMKGKTPTETFYQSIYRGGHNPYEEINYAIYGETLGVDMNKKNNLEIVQVEEQVEQQQKMDNRYMYERDFIERAEKLTEKSAAVTDKDLSKVAGTNEKNRMQKHKPDQGNISNMVWNIYKNEGDRKKYEQVDSLRALTTMQSRNMNQSLENNALFQNDDEQEQMKEKVLAMKIMARKGIRSDAIYSLDQKGKQIYSEKLQKKPLQLSLIHNCTIDRTTFDSLRKSIQVATLQEKLKSIIQQDYVPDYFPRNVDEIRELSFNPTITRNKIEIATFTMLQ